jgi:DNA-nicking Smr family endonuclease
MPVILSTRRAPGHCTATLRAVNVRAVRKVRPKGRPTKPGGAERRRDEAFANSLSEKLREIDGEIRRARERRVRVPQLPKETRPIATPRGDEDLFRDATAGAQSLSRAPTRVVTLPSLPPRDPSAATRAKDLDPTDDEHFDFRFSDLYVQGRAAGVSRETVAKLSRGEFAVRSHVDLHGMALDDAKAAVDQFLTERQKRGDRCVLVITGKGKNSRGQVAVLREQIPEWLARGPSARRVLAFVTARRCDGGEGAFYVLLRRDVSRKMRIDVEAGGGS